MVCYIRTNNTINNDFKLNLNLKIIQMEKLNVNHEQSSVAKAFIGENKYWRLESQLMTIVHSEGHISERIANAVERYADTTEDAVGIAILIFQNVVDLRKGRQEDENDELGIIKSMIDALTEKEPEKIAQKAISSARLLDYESLEKYMNSVDCSTCISDGKCSIQNVAKERGLR